MSVCNSMFGFGVLVIWLRTFCHLVCYISFFSDTLYLYCRNLPLAAALMLIQHVVLRSLRGLMNTSDTDFPLNSGCSCVLDYSRCDLDDVTFARGCWFRLCRGDFCRWTPICPCLSGDLLAISCHLSQHLSHASTDWQTACVRTIAQCSLSEIFSHRKCSVDTLYEEVSTHQIDHL